MNTSVKSSSKTKQERSRFLFRRLDMRLPWLKWVLAFVIGFIAVLDLVGFTISKITENLEDGLISTPMEYHPKILERNLENKKLVALTFDDGPSGATTPRLLRILEKREIPATFFMLGSKVRANADLVRQVEKAGHEVASHTMSHQNLIRISKTNAQNDIAAAKTAFVEVLGHEPTLTRPPYGNFNSTVSAAAGTPLILWSVDTLDWKNRNTESIVSTTMSQVHDGAIILMHDIHPTTVDAVSTLADTLRDAGYEFVTVSELAKIRQKNLKNGAAYYNLKP